MSVYFGSGGQDDRMRQIDSMIDDGNLATGMFQKRASGYIHIIEQR